MTIENWNGKLIEIVRSKSGVILVKDIFDNLLMPSNLNILPIELMQKLYKDNHERAIINGLTPPSCKNHKYPDADNYSYLQSINSEDALVWSYFSYLVYGNPNEKYEFTKELFERLGIEEYLKSEDNIEYFLWRRIPHPDNRSMSGPEIDFGIMTNNVFLIGEAKWNSDEGKKQGENNDKSQLQLRQEFLEYYQDEFLKDSNFKIPTCIFLLYLTKETVTINNLSGINPQKFKNMTWGELVKFKSHPQQKLVEKYYKWKISFNK